jgi:hypothetical protein
MKATLPNGTTLEGTPEELQRFIDKPIGLQPLTHKQATKLVYDILKTVIVHELAEQFYVDGIRVYDPHSSRS